MDIVQIDATSQPMLFSLSDTYCDMTHDVMPRQGDEDENESPGCLEHSLLDTNESEEHDFPDVQRGHAEVEEQIHGLT